MDSYTHFLKQVLDNETLRNEVDKIILDQPDALNLITFDWEKRLKNNILYQEFSENGDLMFRSLGNNNNKNYHYELVKNKSFNVLVAAQCRFPKNYTNDDGKKQITTIDAKPLEEIAIAMYSDLKSSYFNLSTEFKFNFTVCSPLSCNLCKEYASLFNEKGYTMKKMLQPCICSTRIFDGKNIVNRFICHIENMFTENFMALLMIKLDTRYNYTMDDVKIYRIGGKIIDMVAFQESKLCTPRSINMGNLIDVDSSFNNIESENLNTDDNILKLPEFDLGLPVNKKRCMEGDLKLDDKFFDIFKLPESTPEFEAALPLNKKQDDTEDLEIEEEEELLA